MICSSETQLIVVLAVGAGIGALVATVAWLAWLYRAMRP